MTPMAPAGRFTPPAVGLGGAQVGNLNRAISDGLAAETVDAAWSAGVRYFDTAPHYGLGLSERRLGDVLRVRPRDEYVVSTKVGRLLTPVDRTPDTSAQLGLDNQGFHVPATHRRVWDFSRDGVLRSVEGSLSRLGLDRVDVLYLHDPDDHWDQALNEGYPALAELRDQGVVRAIGVGMNQSEMPARFIRHTDIDLVMLAGRYTLLEQDALGDLLPLCEERGVSVVAAGVFNSGLLSRDRPAPNTTYNYMPAPRELIERASRIADVCERHGTTLPAAAVQFPLAHPAVMSVVVGAGLPDQVRRNLRLFDASVPHSLWRDLISAGLLTSEVPNARAAS